MVLAHLNRTQLLLGNKLVYTCFLPWHNKLKFPLKSPYYRTVTVDKYTNFDKSVWVRIVEGSVCALKYPPN